MIKVSEQRSYVRRAVLHKTAQSMSWSGNSRSAAPQWAQDTMDDMDMEDEYVSQKELNPAINYNAFRRIYQHNKSNPNNWISYDNATNKNFQVTSPAVSNSQPQQPAQLPASPKPTYAAGRSASRPAPQPAPSSATTQGVRRYDPSLDDRGFSFSDDD